MTLPVASALKLVKSFKQAIFLSIFLGETSVIVGIISAYHLGVPPGGNIVMVAILILIVTLAFKKVNKQFWIKKSNENIEQST